MYAVLELWVQVCGASAGVLQAGASGEALLTHLLSDISPPADALKVSEALPTLPVPGLLPCTPGPCEPPLEFNTVVSLCPAFLFVCL